MDTQAFELFWIAASVTLLILVSRDSLRHRELRPPALYAIAGLSIFWQEFYADWGAFLAWNPAFHMMPWGATPFTVPNKPWFNLAAYPVFMWAAFSAMQALLRRVSAVTSQPRPLLLSLLVAAPILYLFNAGTEVVSVAWMGFWTYENTLGPALRTAAGNMPLVYPGVPFALFGAMTCFALNCRDDNGKPRFEQWIVPREIGGGWRREALRAMSWMLTWNLLYGLCLSLPLVLLRVAME